ncbi:VOC family protein [Actinomycetospora chibensis]|uniref:VOC family protein n=1 Tax=Actinomycetospora chibensis TaxID=663606 RepID=A0ABV9RQK3_9PSEU|nr:VOC family protein [Actinomycetospora chibensis]MDD7924826.1 VOC family protein [Actinomycetospora chibensis]
MTVQTVVHLNFRGDAREALEFYRDVSGGELTTVTYEDLGAVTDPSEAKQVMWGQVVAGGGFHVMAFDVPADRAHEQGVDAFFVSIRGTTSEEVERLWNGLSEGATVRTAFGPAPWSPAYGMLTDRFGVTWVLDVAVAS